MSKYKEAIEAIKSNYPPENYTMLRDGLDLAIEALEKQIPKKIIETPAFQSYYSAGDESETLCPSCENELEIENQIKYCCECGQKLDWSDFE